MTVGRNVVSADRYFWDEMGIPSELKKIGDYAFGDCKQLTDVEIPSGIEVGSGAFCGSGLVDITIPRCSLEGSVFAGCRNLKRVIIKGITNDSLYQTFYECENLEEVVFPDEWEGTLSSCEFYSCKSLKELSIPEGVKTIGSNVWLQCLNLKTLHLPHSLTQVNGVNCEEYHEYGWNYDPTSITEVYYKGTEENWNKIFSVCSLI